MAHEHPNDLIAAYALDALSEDERAQVRSHLAVCESCRVAAAEFRQVVEVLPVALTDDPEPSPDLRDRILAASRTAEQIQPETKPPAPISLPIERRRSGRNRWMRFGGWVAAAALFLISLGMGAWNLSLQQQLQALQQRPALQAALLATADGGNASGKVILSADHGGLLSVTNLPPPGGGRVYEAWVINAKGPRAAGTFVTTPGGQGNLLLTAPVLPGEVVAITAEPNPGTASPTGKILLKGSV